MRSPPPRASSRSPSTTAPTRRTRRRSTFFLIADRIPGHEPLVADLVARGHELGHHMTRDEPSVRLSRAEFGRRCRRPATCCGASRPVRWLRPASGWYTRAMLDDVERAGYRCALGSVYPVRRPPAVVRLAAAYVLANVRPGAVVVLHEGGARGRRTAAVLRRVMPALRARGYRVVTLSALDALRRPPG
jgi:peptidoglycan/xylan/chitin deacetylase (PgdA/CDA1 family)